jgi:hypothetical protein
MAIVSFKVAGLKPPDYWDRPDLHADYGRAAVVFVLRAKDQDLAKGLDAKGKQLARLRPSTIAHRYSAMGPADPKAPPLTPAHGLSRTRSLLKGEAKITQGYVRVMWDNDPISGQNWGSILKIHKDGGPHLAKRNVIGLSAQGGDQARADSLAWWEKRKSGPVAVPTFTPEILPPIKPKFLVTHVPKYVPLNPSNAIPKKPARVGQIGINGHVYTLQGGSAAQILRSIENGSFSGFGKVADFKAGGGAPLGAPPPKPPAPKPAPKPKAPAKPKTPAKPKAPAPAPPKPAPKPTGAFPASPADVTHVKGLGGSTGATLVQDAAGKQFVKKSGANAGHLREEAHADAIYHALGVPVAKSKVYDTPTGPVKLAEYLEGKTLGELMASDPIKAAAAVKELQKHAAADLLLGNWDVVGQSFDNVLVTPSGTVVRIDNGGSLRYRAQGAKKDPSQWTGIVGELQTMRDSAINPSTARAYRSLTDDELKQQVLKLVTKRADILDAAPPELRELLGKRLDYLHGWATAKAVPPTPAWSPTPAADFHRFDNAREMEAYGKKAWADWAKSVKGEEVTVLKGYSGTDYIWMNARLRGNTSATGEFLTEAESDKAIAKLRATLERGRTDRDLVTYRGVSDYTKMGKSSLADFKPGDLHKVEAFDSTSLSEQVARTFAGDGMDRVVLEIRQPRGSTGAYINAGDYSHVPHERELLMPPDAEYRVVGRGADMVDSSGGVFPVVILERVK